MRTERASLEQFIQQLKTSQAIPAGELICCQFCLTPITSRRQAMVIEGNHTHIFVDSHGSGFHLCCYETAPGCTLTGRPKLDHGWFTGHHWQQALCTDCNELLGWYYHGCDEQTGQQQFFALMQEKLASG